MITLTLPTGKEYEVHEDVAAYLSEVYDQVIIHAAELERTQQAIVDYRVKHDTSVAHPTKTTRVCAYQARQAMFNVVPQIRVKELEFFKS